MNRLKNSIVNFSLSIISVALFLILLEYAATLLNNNINIPHANVDIGVGGKDVLEYKRGFIKDRELFWRLDPACEQYNSLGFRNKEFSVKKDKSTFRIICMGDSVTFGSGSEFSYPTILERLLNTYFPNRNFEVLNAGVPGYTSYQGYKWLRNEIVLYEPDLVIVYYGINDAGGSFRPDKDQPLLPLFIINAANYLRRFQLYQLLSKITLFIKYPPNKTFYPTHRVSPEDYRKNLLSMKKIAQERGFKILFITNPVYYDPKNKIVFTRQNHGLLEKSLLQFNIFGLFKARENQADNFFANDTYPIFFHLTQEGARILAKAIFNALIEQGLL